MEDTIQEQARQLEDQASRVERAEQERRSAFTDILLARFAGLNGELEPLVTYLCSLPLTEGFRQATVLSLSALLEKAAHPRSQG